MAKQSNLAQENLSGTIASLKESNSEIIKANKSMLNQISKTSLSLQELTEKYTNTNALEDRVVDEINTGMNSLQKEILDKNQRNINEVKSGMMELQSKIFDVNLKNSNDTKTEMSDLQFKIIDGNNKSLNELKASMSEAHSKIMDENNKNMDHLYARSEKILDKLKKAKKSKNEEPTERNRMSFLSRISWKNK